MDYKVGGRYRLFDLGTDGFSYVENIGIGPKVTEIFLNILKAEWYPQFFTITDKNLAFHDRYLVAFFLEPGFAFIFSVNNEKVVAIDGEGKVYEKKINLEGDIK